MITYCCKEFSDKVYWRFIDIDSKKDDNGNPVLMITVWSPILKDKTIEISFCPFCGTKPVSS